MVTMVTVPSGPAIIMNTQSIEAAEFATLPTYVRHTSNIPG